MSIKYAGTLCLRVEAERSPGLRSVTQRVNPNPGTVFRPALKYFINVAAEAFEHYFLQAGLLATTENPAPTAPSSRKSHEGARLVPAAVTGHY